jgi:hypothetical protein
MNSKPWYCSRTLWFNLVILMLATAESQLNVLKDAIPGGLYAWLAFVLPVGNGVLRFISTTAITAGKP